MHLLNDLMRRLKLTLMLVTCAWVLTACGGLISAIDQGPVLTAPPENLMKPCAAPVILPDRGLTQAEVETLWRRDRVNLTACGQTLETLKSFYTVRDTGLSGS